MILKKLLILAPFHAAAWLCAVSAWGIDIDTIGGLRWVGGGAAVSFFMALGGAFAYPQNAIGHAPGEKGTADE